MKTCFIILLILCFSMQIYGNPGYNADTNGDGKIDQWYVMGRNNTVLEQKSDNDFNGIVDYLIQYNPNGTTKYEEFDDNGDGKMDTFYFYSKGSLIRQEIDTNYDGKVDVWIHFYKSIYIEKYEWDTNFDGKVDKVKNYSKP